MLKRIQRAAIDAAAVVGFAHPFEIKPWDKGGESLDYMTTVVLAGCTFRQLQIIEKREIAGITNATLGAVMAAQFIALRTQIESTFDCIDGEYCLKPEHQPRAA